jgi:hypothetical protein
MKKCKCCFEEVEDLYNAYLQDRSKVEDVCEQCKKKIEQDDIDIVTHECFEKLCHAVNGGTVQDLADSMFRTFQKQHRYLQNEFFTALWMLFQKYGSLPETHYDQRNEWAVTIAKQWDEAVGVKW